MGNLLVSTDSIRLVWHVSEDTQNPLTETARWKIISRPHAWRPPTDVYEIEDAIIIRVEVAGMRESDFSISLAGRNLIIRGSRQDTSERRAYHQLEIPFGEFSTEFELPYMINSNQVEANYRNGFLQITLPISESSHVKVEGE